MNLQRFLQNCEWVGESRIDMFLGYAEEHTKCTRAEIIARLERGEVVYYGTDWDAKIRIQPAPVSPVVVPTVKCACGHTCDKNLVMSTSRGSSCPDCYDRMSD